MAKNNNLTDFLTDIADAIRAKKSSTDKINPQNFASEIKSIGASNVGSRPKGYFKVTFIDVDGTVLKTQYVAKGGSATPPSNPTREYCTFVKWVGSYTNVTLDSVVGALYKSSDGKTRYKVSVKSGDIFSLTAPLASGIGIKNTVNWGDGSAEESYETALSHTYTSNFEGWISMTYLAPIPNGKIKLTDVILGSNASYIAASMFESCYSLQSVVIPESVTYIMQMAFRYCYSLHAAIIPSNVTNIYGDAFDYCYSLQKILLAGGLTTLKGISDYCYCLQTIVIPSSVTEIASYCFYNSIFCLQTIVIPSSVTEIGINAFYGVDNLSTLICLATTPPSSEESLSTKRYLKGIYVPDASVEAYKAATNWSDTADIILPISQYVEY